MRMCSGLAMEWHHGRWRAFRLRYFARASSARAATRTINST